MTSLLAAAQMPGDPASIVARLLAPPYSYVVFSVAAIFGLWALYLFLPSLIRLTISLINVLARRGDGRMLSKVVGAGLLIIAALGGGGLLYARLPPEIQYYAHTGVYLVLIIFLVLLVVAFITWLTLGAFHLLGGPLLSRRYERFIGWHFLRSHSRSSPLVHAYEGGTKPSAWLTTSLAALFAAAALLAPKAPWSMWVGHSEALVPTLVTGCWTLAAFCLLWPLRRVRRTGHIDRIDHLDVWARRLPNVLTVTVTTFVSIVGVGVGVWALVVVLSVMSGFEQDLRGKILATNPHVVIQDAEPMEGIPALDSRLGKLAAVPGVSAVIPFVQGDVIVSSRDNRNIAMTLRGIDPSDLVRAGHHLVTSIVSGSLTTLRAPERLLPTSLWFPSSAAGLDATASAARAEASDTTASAASAAAGDTTASAASAEAGADPLAPTPIPGVEAEARTSSSSDVRPGLLLGRELALSLRVGVGSEVTVISPRDDAGFLGIQPRARTFKVAGVFATGMYEFDLKLGYVLLSEAQRFFQMGADVNRVELRLSDVDRSGDVVAALQPLIADVPSLECVDWKGLNKNLFSALMLEKIVMFVVLGFITLVASLNVLGSLVMIILDKTREIAVLKSMGATSGAVTRLFIVLGTTIGVIGSTAGLLVGLLTCFGISSFGIQLPKQYYIDRLPVHMEWGTISIVFAAGIGLCTLATLYPAWQAATVDPVEGLRGQ